MLYQSRCERRGKMQGRLIMSLARIRSVWPVLFVFLLGTACQQPAQPSSDRPARPEVSAPPVPPAAEPEKETPTPPVAPKPPPGEVKPPPGDVKPQPGETSPPPTASQPARPEPTPQAEQADEEARRLAEIARRLAEAMPKRPAPSWVIFREAFEETKDATCRAEWTGENRLEVHTDNIKRLTLDLTRLPPGAPRTGPWNLQLDRQGIQITGQRGKVLDLVRSKNGNWAVDHSKGRKRES
jgi:hypothetical protein